MDITGPKPRLHLFGFLDETGLLHTPAADRFFGLGLLVISNPRHLHKSIIKLKQKRNYFQEIKFTSVNHSNLKLYKEFIDLIFNEVNLRFSALVVDKNGKNHTSFYKAYNNYTGDLIAQTLDVNNSKLSEYITILADDVSTSDKDDKFEQDVRLRIKKRTRRNALFGIARLESHAVSEIQMTDLLIGTVAYAFKMQDNSASTTSADRKSVV